jgi:hypothetical protein
MMRSCNKRRLAAISLQGVLSSNFLCTIAVVLPSMSGLTDGQAARGEADEHMDEPGHDEASVLKNYQREERVLC